MVYAIQNRTMRADGFLSYLFYVNKGRWIIHWNFFNITIFFLENRASSLENVYSTLNLMQKIKEI